MMANRSSSTDLKQRLEGKFKRVFRSKKKKNSDENGEASRNGAEAMPMIALINSSSSHAIPSPILSNVTSLEPAQSLSSLPRSSVSRSEGNLIHVPIRELWSLAYERLKIEDSTLVEDYERKLQGNASTALILPLGVKENVREQMDVILRKKMDEVTQDAWKLKFGGAEIHMRDLLPPILAIISHANDYITTSLNTNMYASIAWAGVSLLLPVSISIHMHNRGGKTDHVAFPSPKHSSSISFKRLGEHFFAHRAEPYAGRTVSSPL